MTKKQSLLFRNISMHSQHHKNGTRPARKSSPAVLKGGMSPVQRLRSRKQPIVDQNRNSRKRVEEEYRLRPKRRGQQKGKGASCEQITQLAFESNQKFIEKCIDQSSPLRRLNRVKSSGQIPSQRARASSITRRFRVSVRPVNRIAEVQEQNQKLKNKQESMLEKLKQLQSQFEQEEVRFQRQQKSYERHIATLKGQVQNKKNQFAHLYFFSPLDPATLVVQPIVEVEQQSSVYYKTLIASKKSIKEGEEMVKTETTCEAEGQELLMLSSVR